jgi:SAM-dependent methyltransferase
MSLLVPRRRPSAERLDDPSLPAEEMRRSLEDIALVHRRWGGSSALARHLAPRIRSLGAGPVRILDVGAGSGEVARRLEASLSAAGCDARVIALDRQWRHLAVGRDLAAGAPRRAVAADAFRLPFADGALDLAVSTLFFHHFSPEENRRLLREATRVARHGFALLDLRRHIVPELFVALAGRIVFRTRVSIDDGVASARQAYTREEAGEIARAVSPAGRAERVFPFRLLITGGS